MKKVKFASFLSNKFLRLNQKKKFGQFLCKNNHFIFTNCLTHINLPSKNPSVILMGFLIINLMIFDD
ncbi:hypothetical protein MCRH_0308 [Moraxella catarrhalis RH4]|nr:hypothetical protein MCRH_0308 [Moraxella catarrhalis RH4]